MQHVGCELLHLSDSKMKKYIHSEKKIYILSEVQYRLRYLTDKTIFWSGSIL